MLQPIPSCTIQSRCTRPHRLPSQAQSFRVRLFFAAAAVLLLAVSSLLPTQALADGTADDSPEAPHIVGSFDRNSYELDDQAVVTFSVENVTPVAWHDVRLQAQLPPGVELARGSGPVAEVETLAAGDTLELKIAVLFDASLFKRLASTGDDAGGGAVLACAAVAAFALLAAATFSHKDARSRRARGGMGVFMSVVLVAGLAPLAPREARADDAAAAGSDASATSFALAGSATCATPQTVVPATLTVGSTDQIAQLAHANVHVANDEAVSANARFAQVVLASDKPFAADLSADDLTLGGDFEGLAVTSAERTSDTAATVRIDGNPGVPGARGVVLFQTGSFKDPAATGEATVAVEEARITFDVLSDSCTYDETTGTFAIPVTLENGRFAPNADAARFAFANPTLTATSFAVDPDDGAHGTLEVTASDATPQARFNALAAALDADQPTVDPAALIGEAACVIAHPAFDDGNDGTDDTITTAEAAAAVPYGVVKATRTDKNTDGSLTVSNTVTFGALDGAVSISNANQITLPGQENATDAGSGLLENSKVTLGDVRPDGFDFTFTIDAATVSSWYDAYQASGLTTDEADAQFLDEMTLLMCGHKVNLSGGAVLNKFGIPQEGTSVVNLSDPSLLNAVNGTALLDYDSDMDTAKKVFDALSKVVSAIGYFCSDKPSDIAQGVSQLLGIIASLLNVGPEFTIKDVLDQLQQMKGQLTRLETSVDNLAIQLKAIDKRGGFESDWYEVKWLMDHLNSYGTLYTSTIGSLSADELANGGTTATTFDELTPENQQALTQFSVAVDVKNKLLSTSVYADTMNLGSLVLGTGSKDAVSDYYHWIETYYSWDVETFEAKDVYLGMMMTSYLYGYTSSMAYLSTLEGTGTPDERLAATLSKEELKEQAGKVIEKLAGTLGTDENGKLAVVQKSALRQATEPLPGKQVRCLLNDRVYDEANDATSLLRHNIYEGCRFSKSYERDDVHFYTFNGSLNLAQWQQMAANLPQARAVKGYENVKTVYDELEKVGIKLDYPSEAVTVGDKPRGVMSAYEVWHYDGVSPTQVAVSDENYTKTSDQTAVRHVRTVTIDVFDIKTHRVSRGVTAARHEGVYWVGHGWGYLHDIWPWRSS